MDTTRSPGQQRSTGAEIDNGRRWAAVGSHDHAAARQWRFESLGAALRELREARGLPLRTAAPALSVSFAELSKLERGLKPVPMTVAEHAEQFFSAQLQARNAAGSLIAAARAAPPRSRRRAAGAVPEALAGPPPPTLLLGREQDQARLVQRLREGGITTLDALPGSGTTALVAAALNDVRTKYPGGVLTADLADSTDPDAVHAVLARWLVTTGTRADDMPAGVEERAVALGRGLQPRPWLLIVENATHSAQLRALLPLTAAGCDLVVTSHRRLPTLTLSAAAKPLTLRPLAAETGARLLRALDRDARLDSVADELLEAISRLCGGLPCALHTVSDHLRRDRRLTASDLHEVLADPTQRLDVLSDADDERDGLRARLTRSYAALPPNARWLFRTLGLHGGQTVTQRGAAALAGQSCETVLPGLQQLADAHLLEPTQPDRWIWHHLPLLLASELVHRLEDPYERVHAVRRWVHWLIRVATAAAHGSDPDDSHTVLDAETLNLAAATTAAAHHGQAGLIRQLISLLDQAGRPDLAERCEPARTKAGTAPRWLARTAPAAPQPQPATTEEGLT